MGIARRRQKVAKVSTFAHRDITTIKLTKRFFMAYRHLLHMEHGISCPSHSHFEVCGTGCPATCYSFSSPVDCEKSCTEGCYCDSGFLLSGDECVPISQCGCVFRERYYKKWEKFYPEGQCKDQCQCGEFGAVQCQAVTCGPNEECRVVNGVHGCHSTGQGTCVISGSSHYISFDGLTYNFYGTCSYVLAEVCSGDLHLGNFSIVVENENVGNSNKTVTRSVKVNVYGYVIAMERGMQWKVKVNEEINVVPLILEKGKIRINQEGNSIILQTDFDLMVLYDAMFSARLTIPGAYRSAICGLCGDFNGQSNDDFRRPSGELSANVEEFGASWKTNWEGHDCVDGRKEPHNGCNPITGAIFGRDEECGQLLIENGPFMECNKLVNATDYFNHCLYDMCAHHGQEQTVCGSLQAYATACQSSGAKMKPWRTPDFCPLSCPDNSHYEVCTRTCDITCASITTPSSCSDRCFEGCECDPGYVFDGDRCVTMDRCGCMYNGRYLSLGASLVIPDCLQRCSCENGGVVMCSNFSCSDTEFCGLQNGNRGCFEKQGTCLLSLQGNLTSFDNLSGPVAHVDTFELASVCNLTSDVWFRLVVITQQCRSEDGFRVSALHAYFPNVSISINPNGEAWVNGHAVELPAQVSSSLSVSSVKGALVINSGTDMELVMSESGELTLHVSPELTGALCGACGNFNRQISDDLQGARGKPAATFSEFIASWQACDFSRCEPLKIRAV
ncbi:IgGFc-binding protein-like [Ascaphus truei]|uniref:IgGFc-binding protein-like n=1 Tax=Ascaphus truei TaxID=8439 RepID=UPI003F5A6013